MNLPALAANLSRAASNLIAKAFRRVRRGAQRSRKDAREWGKARHADVRALGASARDSGAHARAGAVKSARYLARLERLTVPRIARDISVRRELRGIARGTQPILVGPWLSEVGYEVLYWVPFLRWFCDRYGVEPARLVAVSRGGVEGWYGDVASQYVELLELFEPRDFAARNAARQQAGEQKQHGLSPFDDEILARVRERQGLSRAGVLHPSLMFRLLREFWLGNESLHYVLEHTRYVRGVPQPLPQPPPLPGNFVAMKFYSGRAIPDAPEHRRALRRLVEHAASCGPVVALDTGVALDEHQDFLYRDIPGVLHLGDQMSPQRNLGLQTAVIARADRFVGTCGGLAWLAPMMGVDTMAVYADPALLTPHLYAAMQAYRAIGAARFAPVDLTTVRELASVSRGDER